MQEKMKKLHWKCRRGMKEMDISGKPPATIEWE